MGTAKTLEELQAEIAEERTARRAAEAQAAANRAALHLAVGRTLDLAEPLDIRDTGGTDLATERAELYQRALADAAAAGGTPVSEKRKNTTRPDGFVELVKENPEAWAVACEPPVAEALRERVPGALLLSLVEAGLRHAAGLPLDPRRERTPLTPERLPKALFVVACNTASDASLFIRAINRIARAKVLPHVPRGLLLPLKQKHISFDDWFGAALEAEGFPRAAVLVADSATLALLQQLARANRCPLLRTAMTDSHVALVSWSDKPLGWAHSQILNLGKSLSFFSEGDARMAVPGYRQQLQDDRALSALAASSILFKQATVTQLYVDADTLGAAAKVCAGAGFITGKDDPSPIFPRLDDERAITLARMLSDAIEEVIQINEAPPTAASAVVAIAKAQEKAERFADALATYEQALQQAPEDFRVRVATARYLELAGRTADAERTLRGAFAHSDPARDITGPLRDFYRRQGDARKTMAMARLMARVNNPSAPVALAVSLLEAGRPAPALAALEGADSVRAATPACHRVRTVAALAESIPALRRSAEETGAATDYFALAEALRQINQPADAKAAYDRAIELDPEIITRINRKAGPHFFMAGPPRTATTLLRRLLELSPRLGLIEGESAFLTSREPVSLQDYTDKAADVRSARPEAKHIGDKSPQHFSLSDDHVALARTLYPNAKIIITTRDPIARAWSEIKLLRHARVLDANIAATFGATPPWLEEIFENSRYLTHARKWVRHFGFDQVLLVQTEDLERDVVVGCKRIYRWLRVGRPTAAEIEGLQQSWSNRTFSYPLKGELRALLERGCGDEMYRVADLTAALFEEFPPAPAPAPDPEAQPEAEAEPTSVAS